jgi:hypothetical protein
MFNFKEYIIKQLPDYFIENDSYKDVNEKGFVERYLGIFGDELDEYYYTQIAQIVEQVNPLEVSRWEYLDYIAYALGDVPGTITDNTYVYQRMLTYIISIYKIKGTIPSFFAILYPLGVQTLAFQELPELNIVYDEDYTYDQDDVAYDLSCPTCSDYKIYMEFSNDFTADLYQKILTAINLVEPIIANRIGFIMNGLVYSEYVVDVMYDVDTGEPIFDNPYDPSLELTLSPNGTLIVGGDLEELYFTNDQDQLIFLLGQPGDLYMDKAPVVKRTQNQYFGDTNPETPTLKVGWEMYVVPGNWVGDTGIVKTYQWYRDGVPIGGATQINYFTVEADANKTISVKEIITSDNGSDEFIVIVGQIENHLPITITGWVSSVNMTPGDINGSVITFVDPEGPMAIADWDNWGGAQNWGPPWYWYPAQGTYPNALGDPWDNAIGIWGDYMDETQSQRVIVYNEDPGINPGDTKTLFAYTEHPDHHARKRYSCLFTAT